MYAFVFFNKTFTITYTNRGLFWRFTVASSTEFAKVNIICTHYYTSSFTAG